MFRHQCIARARARVTDQTSFEKHRDCTQDHLYKYARGNKQTRKNYDIIENSYSASAMSKQNKQHLESNSALSYVHVAPRPRRTLQVRG